MVVFTVLLIFIFDLIFGFFSYLVIQLEFDRLTVVWRFKIRKVRSDVIGVNGGDK